MAHSLMTPDILQSAAPAILCELERDGFRVALLAGDVLSIAPRSQLTAERMHCIAEHKEAIKALVRRCDEGVSARRDMFVQQLAQKKAPGVPTFLFRPNVPYVSGHCFSCRDELNQARFGRCWRCALAWRLAAGVAVHVDVANA